MKMSEKLTLNDGTILSNSHATQDGQILWVYIGAEITLGEAFGLPAAVLEVLRWAALGVFAVIVAMYAAKAVLSYPIWMGQLQAGTEETFSRRGKFIVSKRGDDYSGR